MSLCPSRVCLPGKCCIYLTLKPRSTYQVVVQRNAAASQTSDVHLQRFLVALVYFAACFRLSAANSGSSDQEVSHYLYDEDADPVMDYHGVYV